MATPMRYTSLMRYLEPDDEFDDGGTPAWRRRHIDLEQYRRMREPGLRGAWRRASPGKILVVAFVLAAGIPAGFAVISLLLAFSWSQITGT